MVLNSDMRNPVQLAWEAATLDRLSGGRVELGLGAGHTPQEYAATGIAWRPPAVRKAALREAVEVIRPLLDGETVTFEGEHLSVREAHIDGAVQDRLPILVGGNGPALLQHAGAHADIVGFQGLGRTHDDGHRHDVRWTPEHLDDQLAQVRRGAGERIDHVELNALVQFTEITDDPGPVVDAVVDRAAGLTRDDAARTPYLLIGPADDIAAKVRRLEQERGIGYLTVRTLEPFGEIIERCA